MTRWLIVSYLVALSVLAPLDAQANKLLLNQEEITKVLSHGPWPLPVTPDPSNRVSGNSDAIALGRQLFVSKELSGTGKMSCASCHRPDLSFAENKARATGTIQLDRNTPALLNLRHSRWFGWGGKNDNLWAQSMAPLQLPSEMEISKEQLTRLLDVPEIIQRYFPLFGNPTKQSHDQNLVNVGKALAAFQETLRTGRSPFDEFRDALANKDWEAAANYPQAAQRGLKIFVGSGKCNLCHSGPLFSNGEFHDAGVPYFVEPGRVDSGRHGGIKALKRSPFTLDGVYSDDPEKTEAWAVRQVIRQHANFGTFRVPGLRNVAQTAPYMHNGSLKTLVDVVRHYSQIDIERLHADGEAILMPLNLNKREISDLIDFLNSLTGLEPAL
jgi:cytochrome c peroxidase